MPTLRELRLAKGWTLQRLAKEVGVSEMTVARWEWTKPHGFEPAMPAKKFLAHVFKTKPDQIAFNTESTSHGKEDVTP